MKALGKYTLEKRIGSGGMADVWLAKGPSGICVLKLPHRHLCDNAEFVKMFLDEASLLAQLHHPGIAQIYDLGQVQGAYYLAMEYVPGFDLMSISLEHERHGELMAVELCARIVADCAAALHYAHEAKGANGHPLHIVHRDVTPHNILLSRAGVVKLIDFGVAKASSTMHRTQAGFVKGKYPYMSPEQITGQVIDRRVDVYALGLVLYELLTNVRAIPGNNEIEQIDAARAGRIRPIEQLRPNVPVPIRQILGACLHFEVEGRYPTALALKEDLEKFLTLERQVIGQEDLLRLFRVVAADQGENAGPDARLTELEQPVSGNSGAVVMPDVKADAAQIDQLGYSPTAPSMKVPAVTPLHNPPPITATPVGSNAPTPVSSPSRPPTTSGNAAVPTSRWPLYALTGLSLLVIVLVLATWQPWKTPDVPIAVVDAGTGEIPGKIDTFTFPPVEDAGQVAAVEVDAGAPEAPEVDAGSEVTPPPAQFARVSITSPVPANIFVDGKKVAVAPVDLELAPGSHTIYAKGENLEKKVTWKLAAGEEKTLALTQSSTNVKPPVNPDKPPDNPPPTGPGMIKIDVKGPGCTLAVDGNSVGFTSFKEVEVPAGSHTVTCEMGEKNLKKSVKVTPGKTTAVEFNVLE
ncbi:MAG: protein kinase [Archangium sp.]|nr:protein kinase [Archangium sp.]